MPEIVLATCLDEALRPQVEVLATSIAWHSCSPNGIVFHVFYLGPRTEGSERLGRFRRGNVTVHLHYVADNPWVNTPRGSPYPPSTYLRLSLPDLLPDERRIVYLDVDTLVIDDIANLFSTDLNGKPLGCAPDIGMHYHRARNTEMRGPNFKGSTNSFLEEVIGLKPDEFDRYSNTGVIVMDLDQLRSQNFTKNCAATLLADGLDFFYADQDAINKTMNGDIAALDIRWNVFAREFSMTGREPSTKSARALSARAKARPRIIHFSGPNKPWAPGSCYGANVWWFYANISPAARELRQMYPGSAVRPFVAPIPRWVGLAGQVTTIRYWLRRIRRFLRWIGR